MRIGLTIAAALLMASAPAWGDGTYTGGSAKTYGSFTSTPLRSGDPVSYYEPRVLGEGTTFNLLDSIGRFLGLIKPAQSVRYKAGDGKVGSPRSGNDSKTGTPYGGGNSTER